MDIEKLIKDKGMRLTKQRKILAETLANESHPISAEEIFDLIKDKINIDLSTVYRNLNTLEENDILLKTTNIDGISYYQVNNKNHKHFITCTICNKKFILDNCPIHPIEEKIQEDTGFIINGHNFEFTGICPDCQKKIK